MNVSVTSNMVFEEHSHPFSLDLCLDSGQAFAWSRSGGWWLGTIGETAFVLRQTGTGLECIFSGTENSATTLLRHYLAMDEDHEAIQRKFPTDDFLTAALGHCAGLRVLRQQPWECLAGFVLSSTKQIIHIQQIWKTMSLRWGKKIRLLLEGKEIFLHTFPGAEVVAELKEKELRSCGMGFRAPNMLNAAKQVSSGVLLLESLRSIPTHEAREQLMTLRGVGPKIADCVLLFSLGKAEAFPVDTWILKVLKEVYFKGKRRVTPQRLKEFATTHFGPYGGHAQQYLFHYARKNPLLVKGKDR